MAGPFDSREGITFRAKILNTPVSKLAVRQLDTNAKVYGVLVDWLVGDKTSSVAALRNGNACLDCPNGWYSDRLVTERVCDAATHLVRMAERHQDDAIPANEQSSAAAAGVRFYLLCIDGIKVVERGEVALKAGDDKYSDMWAASMALVGEIQAVLNEGYGTKPRDLVTPLLVLAMSMVFCSHFACRVLLQLGPWISHDDAQRAGINAIAYIWDQCPMLDVPLFILFFFPVIRTWKRRPIVRAKN